MSSTALTLPPVTIDCIEYGNLRLVATQPFVLTPTIDEYMPDVILYAHGPLDLYFIGETLGDLIEDVNRVVGQAWAQHEDSNDPLHRKAKERSAGLREYFALATE